MTKAQERRIAKVLARHGLTIEQVRSHRTEIRKILAEQKPSTGK